MDLTSLIIREDLSVMEKYIIIFLNEFPNQNLKNLTNSILINIKNPEEYQNEIKDKLYILIDKKLIKVEDNIYNNTENYCLEIASKLPRNCTDKNNKKENKWDEKTLPRVNKEYNNIKKNNIKKNNIKKNKNSLKSSSKGLYHCFDLDSTQEHHKLGSVKRRLKNDCGNLFVRKLKILIEEAKKRRTLELTNTLKSELSIKGLRFDKKWDIKSTQACYRLVEKHSSKVVSEALKWFINNKFWCDKVDNFTVIENNFNKFLLNRKNSTLTKIEVIK